ncbi:MAG: TIGR03617 family F420-dependent LLM class oxidoreductase [Acidobacteria bacterium]|nr:TIGR03617 family F420-dependent LLM class oxidoreductase [Acidobacteriota bacterium]
MRVESVGYQGSIADAVGQAAEAEQAGFDTWWATETKSDVFLSAAAGAAETGSIRVGTGIAVALARNPMLVAVQANDIQAHSGGRFALGLGAQIKPHIERRFSMDYSSPAARMREFILAVRAIWKAWEESSPLEFEGEFYTHNLMTPMFDPGPNPHGNPPVQLAAVGPLMTETAGEVADGVAVHGFCTERYLREVQLPAMERGREKVGKAMEGFEINTPGFPVIGDTEEEIAAGIAAAKSQIGFYGSTPAYRPVLELEGWGELGEELTRLSKSDGWGAMPELIDDEVLAAFTVIGTPEEAGAELRERYGDVATRVVLASGQVTAPQRERFASALNA